VSSPKERFMLLVPNEGCKSALSNRTVLGAVDEGASSLNSSGG